jgi:hypothetical protein
MPLMKAARYEPVRSNTRPDNQPPSAMPRRVEEITTETVIATFSGAKYSRTISA